MTITTGGNTGCYSYGPGSEERLRSGPFLAMPIKQTGN